MITMPGTAGCTLCVLVLALTVSGCSEEQAPPAPAAPVTSAAPAPPASTDTPDQLFPELGKNFGRSAVMWQRVKDSNATDPIAWGEVHSLQHQRSLLIGRANAMLTAHPNWKDSSRQWFDRTTLDGYERHVRAVAGWLKVVTPGDAGTDVGRQQEKAFDDARAWLAKHDPAALPNMVPGPAADKAEHQAWVDRNTRMNAAWKALRDQLGLEGKSFDRW